MKNYLLLVLLFLGSFCYGVQSNVADDVTDELYEGTIEEATSVIAKQRGVGGRSTGSGKQGSST